VLIWNTKSQQASGEVLAELSTSSQWCFDAAWCPRNPAVIAAASFDGRVGVHSILGGRELRVQVDNSHIADSFPGMVSALPAGPIEETVCPLSSRKEHFFLKKIKKIKKGNRLRVFDSFGGSTRRMSFKR